MSDKVSMPGQDTDQTRGELEFLCVCLDGAVYGFEMSCVQEIIAEDRITPLPCVPEYYKGLCNWKGNILPVASFFRMAGESDGEEADESIIMVMRAGDYECGFLVREEPEIQRVGEADALAGEIPDRKGDVLRIKKAYEMNGRVLYLVDMEETLQNMVVYA